MNVQGRGTGSKTETQTERCVLCCSYIILVEFLGRGNLTSALIPAEAGSSLLSLVFVSQALLDGMLYGYTGTAVLDGCFNQY